MQDLIDNLSEAFKARDLGAVRRKRATVVVHGDPDLLALWVSYEAILSRHADEQSWHSAYLGMCAKGEEDAAPHLARSSVLLATYDRVLARLDSAWTAYLALRAQQEPAGE